MTDAQADQGLKEQRISHVLQLMARGWRGPVIVQNIAAEWGLATRQAYNYLRMARARMRQAAREKEKRMLEIMLARHDDLRDKGYEEKDLRLVLEIDREDAKLLGLYAPTKIAPTDPTGEKEYAVLTDDERARRVAALLKETEEAE